MNYSDSLQPDLDYWSGKYGPREMENPTDMGSKRSELAFEELRMKEKVNLHFGNHWQKWKRQKICGPWKVFFHILLVITVSIQVVVFGGENSKFTRFLIRNKETFEHYFTQTKCDQDIEKLYTLQDVYDQITIIVDSYYNVSKQAVGSFTHVKEDGSDAIVPPTLSMKIIYYGIGCGKDESNLFPYNSTNLTWYIDLFPRNISNANGLNNNIKSCCNTETKSSTCSLEYCNCDVEDQIDCYIRETNLNRINKIMFNFTLSTFFRNHIIEDKGSVNAKFNIQITILNDLYSSMTVKIDLDSELIRYSNCESYSSLEIILDSVIMLLLILSSMTYIHSLIGTCILAKKLKNFFKKLKDTDHQLSYKVAFELFNKWYIFMLFTNLLILAAVIMKIVSERQKEISILLVEWVRILLGIGVFVLWCGLFGLLSYVDKFYELFNTIQIAIPKVLRFAVCIVILFIAFLLSGWLVLGPYHPKFEDIILSVESLYCILNGDDLYATFEEAHLSTQSVFVKIFSEVYLALFIFIFIYVILSIIIGIFDHAYDSLSKNATYGTLRQWAKVKDENSNAASNTAESDVAPINATKGSRTTTKIEGAGVGSVKKRLPSDASEDEGESDYRR